MKIAIPSDDGLSVAFHFGRTRGFLLFDLTGGDAKPLGYRVLPVRKHGCSCTPDERPSHHRAVLDALEGCSAVIARGIGPQMYDDIRACEIDVALTDVDDAPAAAALFLAGRLPERTEVGCGDSH